LNQYTVFRRRTGKKVIVKPKRFSDTTRSSREAWQSYQGIAGWINSANSNGFSVDAEKASADFAKNFDGFKTFLRWGLVEEGQNILHGFSHLSFSPAPILESFYAAPWNLAARRKVEVGEGTQLSGLYWTQTERHDQIALRGVGWTMMALSSAYTIVLCEAYPELLPLVIEIDRGTDAVNFYVNVLGLDCNRGKSKAFVDLDFMRFFLPKALEAEQMMKPGWERY